MYVSNCWAYEPIHLELSFIQETIHLSIENKRQNDQISLTLSRPQVETLAAALASALQVAPVAEDPLNIQERAVVTFDWEKTAKPVRSQPDRNETPVIDTAA